MIALKRISLVAVVAAAMVMSMAVMASAENFCNFDDLTLADESHFGGATGTDGTVVTGFISGDWYFGHTRSQYSWDGFTYSNETDTITSGWTNQFSAITGEGANGSENYAIYYPPYDASYLPTATAGAVTGDSFDQVVNGIYVTNTTYAYLSMQDGDNYTTKFGDESGDAEDWFMLTIKGVEPYGAGDGYTGSVDFYLADYRFADSDDDYIVDEWTWVDLTSLGNVAGLEFSLSSNQSGVPTYFAFDGGPAPVPEPGTLALFGSLAVLGLLLRRRRA